MAEVSEEMTENFKKKNTKGSSQWAGQQETTRKSNIYCWRNLTESGWNCERNKGGSG